MMLWTLLRIGWGNTAAIFALVLLPIVTLASVASDQSGLQQVRPILETKIAATPAFTSFD